MSAIFTILLAAQEFDAGEAFETLRQNVPLIGFLWFICVALIIALLKIWNDYKTSVKERLADRDKHAEEITKLTKEYNEKFEKAIKERIEAEEEFRRDLNNIKTRK